MEEKQNSGSNVKTNSDNGSDSNSSDRARVKNYSKGMKPQQTTPTEEVTSKEATAVTLPVPNYESKQDNDPIEPDNENSTLSDYENAENNRKNNTRPWYAINRPLISIKIILFCWYAAGACLLPYMTLHMQRLGLTTMEMTLIYAILPIIQLLGTPIAGFIADRTGNYKSVLLFTLSVCIFTTFLLQSYVPARKIIDPATTPQTADAEEEHDPLYKVTFWLYLIIRIFHQVAVGLTYVLLDTTTLVLAGQNGSNYGRQRFWAILATGVFSPICGAVIDQISTERNAYGNIVKNYDPAFYFFNALTAITLFKVSLLNIEISALPRNVWQDVKVLLKSANVWIFLFSVFIMGSCWGFLESFLFVHLEKIGAPTFLLGLTVTVGALIGLPFLFESDWFVKKFTATGLLIFALVVYAIRLVGYSLLENPWWCIPYELMEAFTLHLMWVSTVGLAYKISPPGLLATLQAIVGGLNFGVGRGFGSLVGGSVMVVYGIRVAFRVLGTLALATAVLWAILHYSKILRPLDKLHENPKTGTMMQRRQSHRRSSGKDIEANRKSQAVAS